MSKYKKVSESFKRNRFRVLVLLLVIFAGLGFVLVAGNYYNQGAKSLAGATKGIISLPLVPENKFVLGLDLQGGTQLIYEADVSSIAENERMEALEGVRDIIERRVNSVGISEPMLQVNRTFQGDYRVIVELAGIKDVNEAIKLIGETPLLEFKEERTDLEDLDLEPNLEAIEYNKEVKERAEASLATFKENDNWEDLVDDFQASFSEGELVSGEDEFLVAALDSLEINGVSEILDLEHSLAIVKLLKKDPLSLADLELSGIEDFEINQAAYVYTAQLVSFPLQNELADLSIDQAWQNTELSGKNLKRASLQFDPRFGSPEVALEFDSDGSKMFADITARNIGKAVAIFLDGYAISVPMVNDKIPDGRAVISGNFNVQEAKLLVQRLNTGALPVPIELVGQQNIGASLGMKSVNDSVKAGFIGFALVALFMILFYRLPGLLSVISLSIYTITVLSVFKASPILLAMLFILILVALFLSVFRQLKIFDGFLSALLFLVILVFLVFYASQPITLTLAGITGFILSVGMAVDANILIFARLREELVSGKALNLALEDAFRRAWPSIRDGNITTILICFILMGFGSGLVKGFGATLFIGVSISMFSSIVITYILLKVFNSTWLDKHRWLLGSKMPK